MLVRSIAGLTLAAALLAGCGSDTATNPTGVNTACSLTLSGAQSGTFTCQAVAAWVSQNDSAAVAVTATNNTTTYTVILGVGRRGQWSSGTYTNTASDALGVAAVETTSGAIWLASSAAANNGTAYGSYTLNLTSADVAATVTGGKTYTVHGTFDATAPAVAGTSASGTVTMHASF